MPGKPESGASVQIFGGRETETVKQEGASGVCGGGRVCVDVCVWLGHVCMWTCGGGGGHVCREAPDLSVIPAKT